MTRYLLDSNVLIDWLRGRALAVALFEELNQRPNVIALNAVTIAETYSGLTKSEARDTDEVLSAFDYWTIDQAVARLAGIYRYQYARQGRQLAVPDLLLGAHAVLEDATLVTANVRDFPMPELKILPIPHD